MKLLQTLKNIRKTNSLSWLELVIIFLFFVSFSFGQLGRVEWAVTFYIHDLVIVAWILLKGFTTLTHLTQKLKDTDWKRKWVIPTLVLWALAGMIISFAQTADTTPFLYVSRLILYALFLFSLRINLSFTPHILRILLICSITYMAVFGILQYLLIPDTRYLFLFGWDDHYYRLIGSLLDPNMSGIVFTIGGWLVYSLRRQIPKRVWITMLVGLTTAVVLTYSRATYLASVLSIIVFWLLEVKRLVDTKRVIISCLVLLFCVGVYLLAPKPGGEGIDLLRTASISARVASSKEFIGSLESYEWLTGAGFYSALYSSDTNSHARVPDNIFVLILTSTGVLGIILFFTAFTKLKPLLSTWEPEILAAFIALFIHAQFNNSLLEPFLFLSIGIAIISQKRLKTTISKGYTQR